MRSYAERRNAVILAEGIETPEQESLARVFGATYVQGYLYGRPGPLPTTIFAPSHPIPLRQRLAPITGRSPFAVLAEQCTPQTGSAGELLHIRHHLEDQAEDGPHASVLLAGFQHRDFFTAETRARYDQLAKVNALTVVLADELPRHDEPTYHLGPTRPGSPMAREWVIIVLKPQYASAFALRAREDAGPDEPRQFDFVYTHNREAVIDAARCFVQDLAIRPDQMTDLAATSAPPRPSFDGDLAAAALDALPDATAVIDQHAVIVAVNHTWRMFAADNGGDPAATGVGVNYLQVCERAATASPDAAAIAEAIRSVLDGRAGHVELEYPCPSPAVGRWFLLRIAPLSAPTPGALISHVNITRRKLAEADLEHRAAHDPLIRLANRALFGQRLEHALTARPGRPPRSDVGVLYLDLDGFKTVNDVYGHDAGDELLMSAGRRLKDAVRAADTVARLGGDEFAVLAPRISPRALTVLIRRIDEAMARPYLVHGQLLVVPASVGAHLADRGEEAREALRRADAAMYAVKGARSGRSARTDIATAGVDRHRCDN